MATKAWFISRDGDGPFTIRLPWRLALWGTGATLALSLAAAAAYSDGGSRRLAVALHSSPAGKTDKGPKREVARAVETNTAVAETLRMLALERDRLAARVSNLERHLDDLTGSIAGNQRQVQKTRSEEGMPQSAPEPMPTGPARAAEMPPERREEGRAIDTGVHVSAANELPKGEYGADIGSAASFEALRTLWSSTKTNNPDVFENLYPLVSVQENIRTRAPQLRLIVGPFVDWEEAGRFCVAVGGARSVCQPTAFEGQRLADADRPTERKPAAPRSAPRPSLAPQQRLFGLF
ncbi:MAG: hypothetical protein ABWZ64_10465 [Xanthobacteraceae bacterium]